MPLQAPAARRSFLTFLPEGARGEPRLAVKEVREVGGMAESALRRDLVEGEIGVQEERPRPGQPLPQDLGAGGATELRLEVASEPERGDAEFP